jgi:hypothetical protein
MVAAIIASLIFSAAPGGSCDSRTRQRPSSRRPSAPCACASTVPRGRVHRRGSRGAARGSRPGSPAAARQLGFAAGSARSGLRTSGLSARLTGSPRVPGWPFPSWRAMRASFLERRRSRRSRWRAKALAVPVDPCGRCLGRAARSLEPHGDVAIGVDPDDQGAAVDTRTPGSSRYTGLVAIVAITGIPGARRRLRSRANTVSCITAS